MHQEISTNNPKPFVQIAIDLDQSNLQDVSYEDSLAETEPTELFLNPFLSSNLDTEEDHLPWEDENSEDDLQYKDEKYRCKLLNDHSSLSNKLIPLRITLNNDPSMELHLKAVWAHIYFPNSHTSLSSANTEQLNLFTQLSTGTLEIKHTLDVELPSLVVFYSRSKKLRAKKSELNGIELSHPPVYSLSLKNLTYEMTGNRKMRIVTRLGEGISMDLHFFNEFDERFWINLINAQQRIRFQLTDFSLGNHTQASLYVSSPRISRRASLEPLSEINE